MKSAVNFFLGTVRVRAESPYPERVMNICAQNHIPFWDYERVGPTTVEFSVYHPGYRKLGDLAQRGGFTIERTRKIGVPFFLWRLRRRHALLIGLVAMLLAVWSLSLFVWEINVSGNETLSAREILEALDELGVGIGSFGPTISSEAIANDMLLKIPKLQWIAVNVSGSRAQVLVRERIDKPEILDKTEPIMVYAVKSGIIKRMSVLEGKNVVKEGDTVQAGDLLVTGIMDSLSSGKRAVHAMAEVWARTWYDLSASMPLTMTTKEFTGREKTKTALFFAGGRLNLYFNSRIAFTDYDKMTTVKKLTLPTGNVLPISVVRETYREYAPRQAEMTILEAEQILQKRLLARLSRTIGDGQITSTNFTSTLKGDVLTVSLAAECLEQIAAERPFTPEEILEMQSPSEKEQD
jgi:similar to stage IV sporulation protein